MHPKSKPDRHACVAHGRPLLRGGVTKDKEGACSMKSLVSA
jgi:hypothetical protein